MRLVNTDIAGVLLIELERLKDERGFFARAFCAQEFAAAGAEPDVVQVNLSYNARRGTLRGLHFQRAPYQEGKVIRVVRGAIWDVVVDIRPGSPTFGRWFAAELDDVDRRALYAPPGTAHGFLTLRDDTEVLYLMSTFHAPGTGAGICWNDPTLAIHWPFAPEVVSAKDAALPRLAEAIDAG